MNISEIILSIRYRRVRKRLLRFIREQNSVERYEHILRVTATCRALAPRFSVNPARAEILGLAHDMVREWPDEKFLQLVNEHGYIPNAMEREKPLLLHGRCAAILLRRDFGVRNRSMLRSLEDHTLGRWGMDLTGILLFVSDYLEPGRKYTTPEFRERVMNLSPWEMVLAVNEHAKARGKKKSPRTHQLHVYARKMAGLELSGGERAALQAGG
ncbi:bis(5'-nucleosyl)-tetraphosphatase (symmetrical) YqeK [Salinispira pacifica]|uniref:bis(5'-nucleosyl)-tetraphosphatase (symmetrical) YqeK n=1 Tax=Salinispira pacifica TaxID=1307761 RepID=UPI0009DD0AC9|nr:bis(5'-nucleosyl)-tetraphosphatase (symmetrical) YqeK [Salinispira pacifica]